MVVARTAPPAAAPFVTRAPALSRDPGKPLDATASAALVSAGAPSTPIRGVTPAQSGVPAATPSTRPGGFPGPASSQATPRTASPAPPPQAAPPTLGRPSTPTVQTPAQQAPSTVTRSGPAGAQQRPPIPRRSRPWLRLRVPRRRLRRRRVQPSYPFLRSPPGAGAGSARRVACRTRAPRARATQARASGAPPGFARRPLEVRSQGPGSRPETARAPERRREDRVTPPPPAATGRGTERAGAATGCTAGTARESARREARGCAARACERRAAPGGQAEGRGKVAGREMGIASWIRNPAVRRRAGRLRRPARTRPLDGTLSAPPGAGPAPPRQSRC